MASKVIVFVGLSLATVLIISSEVAARELAETSNKIDTSKVAEETNRGVHDTKYPGGGYRAKLQSGYGPTPYLPSPPYGSCPYGCCGSPIYYGGGCQCCSYAGEKKDAELNQAKP